MSRGKWAQKGVPHKGWMYSHLEDLGELLGTCQMCETQPIRFVHFMRHPDYADMLGVGNVCAGFMSDNYAAPRDRERKAKSMAERLKRWMSANWLVSRMGNHYRNTNGFHVVLYQSCGSWSYKITKKDGLRMEGRKTRSRSDYATEEAAKLAAFYAYVELLDNRG